MTKPISEGLERKPEQKEGQSHRQWQIKRSQTLERNRRKEVNVLRATPLFVLRHETRQRGTFHSFTVMVYGEERIVEIEDKYLSRAKSEDEASTLLCSEASVGLEWDAEGKPTIDLDTLSLGSTAMFSEPDKPAKDEHPLAEYM